MMKSDVLQTKPTNQPSSASAAESGSESGTRRRRRGPAAWQLGLLSLMARSPRPKRTRWLMVGLTGGLLTGAVFAFLALRRHEAGAQPESEEFYLQPED